MADRRAAFDDLLALRPDIQRATLDIIGRAYGRIASTKEVADVVGAWSKEIP